MRHQLYNKNFKFVIEPEEFNKYSDREFLQYCLGATMYMPGIKDFFPKIIDHAYPGLTTMVMDMEDACPDNRVLEAEENIYHLLDNVTEAIDKKTIDSSDIPLIFVRVRGIDQFKRFGRKLTKHQAKSLAGINIPKFNAENGSIYMEYIKELNETLNEVLYAMPIIEDSEVAHKETRMTELLGIKRILDEYRQYVLQVRVGGTDFSSVFGVRRGVDYTIYDIMTVRECLSDILNVFGRNNDYVISGPVWEYFRATKEMMFEELPTHNLQDCLEKRAIIYNNEVDGLLRECILDKANGFVGRTVIHPTHVKFVNGLMAVTREEYEDAVAILGTESGVIKGSGSNKMNEIKTHTNWAQKVIMRSKAFGVIENEESYLQLFSVTEA